MTGCVRAKTVYTGEGKKSDAYVVFNGSKVTGISKAKQGKLLGMFPAVTPAFIDAHSHIGMERAGHPGSEGEANERLDSILTLTDALDSVQMEDTSFKDSVEAGVLYSCVVPGSGNIIGGKSAVIRNYADTTTEALVARAGLKAAFGHNPMSTRSWKGARPYTRMGALSLLRKRLYEVKDKLAKKGKKKELSAEEKVLRDVLLGKERLRVHVHKIDDIAALLRIVDEFRLRVTVEHACDVHDGKIYGELKKRKIPVVYGPLDAFAYKVELQHESWRNLKLLIESGVEYGLMTDHPVILQRNLLVTLRWFLRHGMSKEQAIGLVTARNARILGIDRMLGTLSRGKWASFVCWNGDPFDLASHPVLVVAEGRELYRE